MIGRPWRSNPPIGPSDTFGKSGKSLHLLLFASKLIRNLFEINSRLFWDWLKIDSRLMTSIELVFLLWFLWPKPTSSLVMPVIKRAAQVITKSYQPTSSAIQRLRVRRSNFMRSKLVIFMRSNSWGQIFPIFHEVEIRNKNSISWLALFSWDRNCLIIQKSIIRQIWSHDRFVSHKNDHEIEILNKAILGNFNLMIDLLAASKIMRSNDFMLIIKAKN